MIRFSALHIRVTLKGFLSLVIVAIGFLESAPPVSAQLKLTGKEWLIDMMYDAKQMTVDELDRILADNESGVLLVDNRTEEEFVVSHLQHAVNFPEGQSVSAFVKQFGAALAGKKTVIYCSIGQRSSEFIDALNAYLAAENLPKADVYNLRGGIFRWYLDKKPIYNKSGLTRDIHPYNSSWKYALALP